LQDDNEFKDIQKAYDYLELSLFLGVSMFDALHKFFQDHYDILAPTFLKKKKPTVDTSSYTKEEVENLHEAYCFEMKTTFS